jgi:hypothetical protein
MNRRHSNLLGIAATVLVVTMVTSGGAWDISSAHPARDSGNASSPPLSSAWSHWGTPITFTESGLPSGTEWWVNMTWGQSRSSNTTNLSFNESFGHHSYSVSTVDSSYAAPGGGFNVGRSAVAVSVNFSLVTYAVTFPETGLPAGTLWSVSLNGSLVGSGGTAITFWEPNGSYAYSIDGAPGWSQTTMSNAGSVVVSGSPVTEPTLEFSQSTYAVTFSETGLPAGTPWSVMSNGTTEDSNDASLTFYEPNGTYSYAIGGIAGWHETALPYFGSLSVSGQSVTEPTLAFVEVAYAVTVTETGLPAGAEWWVNVTDGPHFSSLAGALLFSEPNGTYGYTVSTSDKTYSSPGGEVAVDGAVAASDVTFKLVTYSVTFLERGLPNGTGWGVTVNGALEGTTVGSASSGDSIVFNETNGSQAYSISPVDGWIQHTLPYSGALLVNGAALIEPTLVYVPGQYAVTFSETGLPAQAFWSVTLEGTRQVSNGSSIAFSESDGTYAYSVAGPSGWHQSTLPYVGSVIVNGGSVLELTMDFGRVVYDVTFDEKNPPTGPSWSVTLNGTTLSSAEGSISFLEPNGTYAYSIPGPSGWAESTMPLNGSVLVIGAPVTEPLLVFSEVMYPVTFTETGLPGGAYWSVTLDGVTESSTTSSITFSEPNGSHLFVVSAPPGYASNPFSGALLVDQAGTPAMIQFASTSAGSGVVPPLYYYAAGAAVAVGALLAVGLLLRSKRGGARPPRAARGARRKISSPRQWAPSDEWIE